MAQFWIAATKSYCGSLILLDQAEHFNDTRILFQNFSTLVKRPDETRPITFLVWDFLVPTPVPMFITPSPHSSTQSIQHRLIFFPITTSNYQFHSKWQKQLPFVLCFTSASIQNTPPHAPTTPYLPHIFSGASSSSRIGWLRKISLDFKHSPLISFSWSWTFLPGFDPLTVGRS